MQLITLVRAAREGGLECGNLCCSRKVLTLGACGFGHTAPLPLPGPVTLRTPRGLLGLQLLRKMKRQQRLCGSFSFVPTDGGGSWIPEPGPGPGCPTILLLRPPGVAWKCPFPAWSPAFPVPENNPRGVP